MTLYVVAGSTQEYERWLRGPGTAYDETIRLLEDPRQINILHPHDRIILLRGWRQRPDWRRIYNRMLATGRTGETS